MLPFNKAVDKISEPNVDDEVLLELPVVGGTRDTEDGDEEGGVLLSPVMRTAASPPFSAAVVTESSTLVLDI